MQPCTQLEFIFFGASTFFTYMIYKNSEINNQTFTETEIETLKSIAKENIAFDSKKPSEILKNSLKILGHDLKSSM